ncbi:MAG TPA: serine/threonine-protein kinase [Haliangium sp.]|nr:serine/threonine-protein kinase [Haliangium sp.]
MASAAGIQFGNYRLIERLAHGGMAEVFLARQQGPEGFDRRVAIKRILPHLADSRDFLRMFLDEARLAASLTHANVVHIYELGKVGEHYFLAMEFIDGVHAGSLIEHGAREPLPVSLVARIGADACAGLNYVHNAVDSSGRPLHLVHRDISPPNLMISYDGVVKLMDFGIAKAVGQAEQTRPGIVKGKFAYMSPEQTTGETLDGRSDVFSLALVMWELLAGRVALPRTDPVEAMTMIRDGKLPPLEAARPDVPPALAAVLAQGLEVDRQHRPSAADLGAALEGFIKSSPELGTAMQLSEWVRRRFPRRAAPGEPLPSRADSGELTDVGLGLGHEPDTDSGLQPSLEVLVSMTGETFARAQGDRAPARAGELFPDEVSDEASAPATTPAAASLREPMLSAGQAGQRAGQAGHVDHVVQGVIEALAAPVEIDPARSFLEEEDEDADATLVTEPPRSANGELLFVPTPVPGSLLAHGSGLGSVSPPGGAPHGHYGLHAHELPASRPTLSVHRSQAASARRPRRALRIAAATLLAALVIGLVLWVLVMRNNGVLGGVLDDWLGLASPEQPNAR